jgi:hypothetical protein
MTSLWENVLLEIGLFVLLGIVYYFYQRRKIIHYEQQKGPVVMGFILQSCLMAKKEIPQPKLDSLIESLDDYLHNKTSQPPVTLLRIFMTSEECPEELRGVIQEGLKEIEPENGKE